MIRNIVFDMGKVMIDADMDKVCKHYMEDMQELEKVRASVFLSQEWLMLDMGIISEEEGLLKMQERLEGKHAKEMAALCLAHWHEYNMWPKEGMEEVVRTLKERGYGIYLCSNASVRLLSCYRQIIPGIQYFDGVLFSAQVKCIKPQKEIYEHFFAEFSLKPEECFFVDDLMLNIEGARDCGMDGYCFADGDVDKLKEVLYSLA